MLVSKKIGSQDIYDELTNENEAIPMPLGVGEFEIKSVQVYSYALVSLIKYCKVVDQLFIIC